ncbi:PREDICTED: transmembrane channel-like protein 3 [Rhagoletis zephyria]|uniref:transmembrane channel-like protein 3 n=1 Tax=Rhagoletis zephyria TaxID=28612 RepID=UPI0008117868|nr:PREDICTED: transmembrane channel-like protein 3 [Rhagoletis zephyria]
MVPEILRGDQDQTGMRKERESDDDSLSLSAIWEFEGYLKYSPIFYGYYSKSEMTSGGYRLPLAYFLTTLCLYMFSFFCVLRKMAQNARLSRVGSRKDDESSAFCFKIFTGWDYMIGNSETACNKVASLVMSLKEAILEEKERKKERTSWRRICLLICTNVCVLALLASSAYAVVLVFERSQEIENNEVVNPSWLRANENSLVVSAIGNLYPNLFDFIGSLENYHPRIALRWQLGRILVLNILNLYTLMLSLFNKVDKKTAELKMIKANISLWRQQVDVMALATVATFHRIKRDGREEYAEYEDSGNNGDPELLFPPAIIYDPYEEAVNKMSGSTKEEEEVVDEILVTEESFSTTFPSTSSSFWISTTPPNGNSGDGGGGGDPTNRSSLLPSQVNFSSTAFTNLTTVSSLELPKTAVSSKNSSSSTRKPKKTSSFSSTKPRSRLKIGAITTTTEAVTETFLSTESSLISCQNTTEYVITDEDLLALNSTIKDRLRKLCWETSFGQDLIKLTVMEFVVLVASTLVGDFFRALFVRYCACCCCWDLEKGWPGYGDFKIAENILHLVNNQGNVWLGMFFCPGLPALNTIKLALLMYFRSWALLTCNIPHETVFKASRSNNFYYLLLLFMLFLCTLPVSYAVVWLQPSWHCGPFSDFPRIYKILSGYVSSKLNSTFNKVLDYLTSPGAVLPLLLLLILFIYYLLSTVSSMKEANRELKAQLRKDKDSSEANNFGLEMGVGPATQISPPTNAKHVRIQEHTSSAADQLVSAHNDKTHLLENSSAAADAN